MRSRLTKQLLPLLLILSTNLSGSSMNHPGSPTTADSVQTSNRYVPLDRHILESHRYFLEKPVPPDSADFDLRNKNHFWRATAEVVGVNLGLWAFDRYVQNGEYARISWNSIKNNFRDGFKWDDDYIPTNFFAHPYNGSIFYNAGRVNGFNYWQSSLFSLGGSAMWELFMECEPPSTNDIIATPVGGTALGEVFYRTSDLIINDRASGAERVGREVAAFLIDPMRGINRIITGEAWKKRTTSGRRFGIPPICAEISFGGRGLSNFNDGSHATRGGFVARLFMEYGNPYEATTRKPYDYFTLLTEVQGIKTQPPIGRIEITGRLLCTELADKKDFNLNLGFYQHFDYFDSDTIRHDKSKKLLKCPIPYKMATPASFGAGLLFRYSPNATMCLDGFTHFNAVILAGTLTDYYRNYHRSYNYGSGFSVKAGVNCTLLTDRLSIKMENRFYRLYTWKGYNQTEDWSDVPWGTPIGVMGDKSNSSFNHLEAEFKCRMVRHWYLSVGLDLYTRRTKYLDYIFPSPPTTQSLAVAPIASTNTVIPNPLIKSTQLGFHLLLTYRF